MKVVIANVTRHHSYQTALAAYQGGYLKQFIAGGYYQPEQLTYRLLERFGNALGFTQEIERMKTRRVEGLPPELVHSIAWPDTLEQVWRKSKLLSWAISPESVTYLKNSFFDRAVARRHLPECDLFHGFEQCALYSLQRARKNGAVTLLDEPVLHRGAWDRLEADERRKLGLSAPKRPPGYHRHVARKYKELELADYLFVGLDLVRRSFIDAGFPADRIFLIPYGVDVQSFPRRIDHSRKRTCNILFVGQISWYKGLHYLLEAYDRMKIQDVKLTIIGLVHPEWAGYFDARFSRVRKPLHYLGTVPRSEMPRHFAEADVFVFPSLGGGIGLATYEAMAAGLPVITSDGDVVIRDGIEGLVVPAEDVDGWARALERLAEDEELRRKLGQVAATRVRCFGWEVYRSQVQKAYHDIAVREGLKKP